MACPETEKKKQIGPHLSPVLRAGGVGNSNAATNRKRANVSRPGRPPSSHHQRSTSGGASDEHVDVALGGAQRHETRDTEELESFHWIN